LLAERWPRCFMLAEDRRLPLKVGIFHDLKAALAVPTYAPYIRLSADAANSLTRTQN
jgi:sRNA-binding protein